MFFRNHSVPCPILPLNSRGITALELIVVLSVVGLTFLFSLPGVSSYRDSVELNQAITQVASHYGHQPLRRFRDLHILRHEGLWKGFPLRQERQDSTVLPTDKQVCPEPTDPTGFGLEGGVT